jgi:CheY-like chemotaxis protein
MRRTLLLVEDREDDVFFLRRALSHIGADVDVRVVSNGAEAQAYVSGEAPFHDREYFPLPDLIVCDFKMPRRGGIEFLQWLRTQENFTSLPFVLLSGSALPHEEDLAIQAGADLYLRKSPAFAEMVGHARRIVRLLDQREQGERPANVPGRQRTVLVIDDDVRVLKMLSDILASFGFSVVAAETSEQGLACARSQRIDVVVCDIILPDAPGYVTAKVLNEDAETKHVPVILTTGYSYMREFVAGSKWKLLLKPFSATSVFEVVMHALEPLRPAA